MEIHLLDTRGVTTLLRQARIQIQRRGPWSCPMRHANEGWTCDARLVRLAVQFACLPRRELRPPFPAAWRSLVPAFPEANLEEGASTALKFCFRSSPESRTCHTSDKCYITRKGDWGVGRGQCFWGAYQEPDSEKRKWSWKLSWKLSWDFYH